MTCDAPPRVLVIDDDEVMLDACRRILRAAGFEVDVESEGLRGRRARSTSPTTWSWWTCGCPTSTAWICSPPSASDSPTWS
jgi:hypothetical protein